MPYGFDVERVSRVEPVELEIQEPPKPVEPGQSKPRRVAGHAIANTLYQMGFMFRQPSRIPMAIRQRNVKRPQAASGPSGQKSQSGAGSVIARVIPRSYSDSVTGG